MKTTMKQLATGTFIALLLLVGNVKAEGTEVIASSHENSETALQLENWMTDEFYWNTNSINMSVVNQETESGLELESWMTSENTWSFNYNVVEETEAGMEIENWMTSDKTWNLCNKSVEADLTVENWMLNNEAWK